jgi:hypothetical protein
MRFSMRIAENITDLIRSLPQILELASVNRNLQSLIDERTKKIVTLQNAILKTMVDVYDALISERPYKKVITHEEAVKIIVGGKGKQFDPVLIDIFIKVSDMYLVPSRLWSEGSGI